ncbi:amino acid ABC transporter permease [Corynebacterium heidelbergense]|uniref:Glutamate ABC transporter permease n=1 Tax=Corynebacterium heidelbergense TaxID=2055947 RepID=A0A364V733_9CORY|nr:amino acid ABC transporter permease [Corynebacterium heidelbergense]RAV32473.1 glutamate ABC transporter permease [Corynebacterium heidelbergense]
MNSDVWSQLGPALLPAFWMTIKLTVLSAIFSMILGTILVAMRVSPVRILRVLSTFYINTVRNTPLTLIVLFAMLGLWVNLNITLANNGPNNAHFATSNAFRLAVLAFTVYTSAFVAESLRSGINTVPFGQAEAARSLGFTFMQNFRYIIFPQALRGSIVPLGNTLIALTKNTTIASVIGVAEASLLMKSTIEKNADQVLWIFGIIALGFVILTLPTGLLFGSLSRRLAVKR